MIDLKNLTFTYDGQTAGKISDINLQILPGECVLLCGRSGCGKTTLTRMINGLIPSFFSGDLKGEALLNEENLTEMPMYALAEQIGSVFQNPRTQFFNVDSESEIAFGIENQALPPEELKQRVEKTVGDLHIRHLCGRSIFALSGGEKQKIAFASVYAMNPAVYLLDEPSSNLDMEAIEELRSHLSMIKKQGKTILIAEHRLYYLMDLADRIVYLDEGKIKGIYTAQELMQLSGLHASLGLRCMDLGSVRPLKNFPKSGPAALELADVTLCYKKETVLSHIDLQVSRGEVVAVTGHNGAGKTTFARALCGLHKETSGQFLWEGSLVDRVERRNLSYMVMQDVGYQLFAESVEKECAFGIKKPDAVQAEKTLQKFGLEPFSHCHPNTLSGGQKQRLAVAVSMVCGKEILVFDEPTSGLDYDSMTQVAALMEQLAERGSIVFVVTHDYELVCQACTRILRFDQGRLQTDLTAGSENEDEIRACFDLPEAENRERRELSS